MVTWHYEGGSWTETSFLDDNWHDGESWEVAGKRLGYEDWTSVGSTWTSFELEVYRREEPPRFLLHFSDGNIVEGMTTSTMPDALDLLARYAPLITAGAIADVMSELWSTDEDGIISHILAATELSQDAALEHVRRRHEKKAERRRALQRKKEERQEPR